jgi:hypothetical protein
VSIFDRIRNEPAILIGLVTSVVAAIQQAVVADGHVDWKVALPLIIGVVIRFFTYGPVTVARQGDPSTGGP